MDGRSASRRDAGLFEERVAEKAAKRGVSTPKLLSRGEPGAFCRAYRFKAFFTSLSGQESPLSGKKEIEVLKGEGSPSLRSKDVYGILVRRPWKMVLTRSPQPSRTAAGARCARDCGLTRHSTDLCKRPNCLKQRGHRTLERQKV